ncbi:hypothetical protein ACSBR2_012758 [Camellia fascicularis]
MEKEQPFLSEDNTILPNWNSASFGIEIQSNELNCGSEQLPNCFLNPNWENSMDQSDPFESALSSMVSSPAASGAGGDGVVIRELIGRLGSICNSSEISHQSYITGNNSTNNSCYSTPLNSPPKLNLSMMDHQIRRNSSIPGNHLPFSADPGFVERAARFSCFGSRNLGGLNGQFGLNESELPHRLTPIMESSKLSRVLFNQAMKVAGSPMGVLGNPENGEFGDSREGSSVSEQIPDGEIGKKVLSDANARKRKSIPRGKAKENAPSSPAKDGKVATESDESTAKRTKKDESSGNEKDIAKPKAEKSENGKAKDSAKPPEPPKDYIHVRARRGQATDSHSLAERVRREKISERMKFLQDLVPGCNKVTGKAVMLDEIINYVQSLQRQVEFLSMKLSTVNSRMDFNMEALVSKDIFQSMPHIIHPLDNTSSPAFPYGYQSLHGPTLHGGLPNGTETSLTMNPLNGAPQSLPTTFWGDDLQSVVQMGFGQNEPQNFHGAMATTQMKVEL